MTDSTGYADREIEAIVEESENLLRLQMADLEQRLRAEQDTQLAQLETEYAAQIERLTVELNACRTEIGTLRERIALTERQPTNRTSACPRPRCRGTLERRMVEGRAQLRCTEFPRCRTIIVLDQ
jgi:hypothetical protein